MWTNRGSRPTWRERMKVTGIVCRQSLVSFNRFVNCHKLVLPSKYKWPTPNERQRKKRYGKLVNWKCSNETTIYVFAWNTIVKSIIRYHSVSFLLDAFCSSVAAISFSRKLKNRPLTSSLCLYLSFCAMHFLIILGSMVYLRLFKRA